MVTRSGPRRPHRRTRSQPWRTSEFVSLDFEATGLDFDRDRIISFGTAPIRRCRIDVGDCRYQLVDPGERPPSPESITVHGLRPVDLVGAPSPESARTVLREILDGRVLVGWYVSVEARFLAQLFGGRAARWLSRTIDVRHLVLALDGAGAPRPTLTEAADRFGVPVADPHHALDDALVTAQLFLVTATRLSGRDGLRTVGDLLRVSPEDPALRRPRAPW